MSNSYKGGEVWPNCGEIDILEMVTREAGRIVFSIHSQERNFQNNNQLTEEIISDCYKKFTEYRMDWKKDCFEYFIDGKKVATINKPINATYKSWPFDKEFYLIINVAVGGSWCGAPDEDFIEDEMIIKYVQVWELEDEN